MRLSPALLILSLSLSLFAATPPLGPAVRLSELDSFGEQFAPREVADIATNGDGYLAVWHNFETSRGIYGSRITAEGMVVDRVPLIFGAGALSGVVWNGRNYVVVYETGDGVYAASLEDDGITVKQVPGALGHAEVATNGNTILVVTSMQQAFLLDRDLNVIREHRVHTTIAQTASPVSVASAGAEYMILVVEANSFGAIVAERIDAEGELLPRQRLSPSSGVYGATLASDGNDWLGVWRSGPNLGGQVLTRDTSRWAEQLIAVADPNENFPDRSLHTPSLAWRGNEYLLAYVHGGWDTPEELRLQRVDRSGNAVGSAVAISPIRWSDDADFAIRGDGSGAMIWVDDSASLRVGLFDATSIATATPFTKTIAPAIAPMKQEQPVVQRVGASAVAAWIERSLDRTVIRIGRIGETPLFVDTDTDADWIDLDVDGTTLWVTWYGDGVLRFRRYTTNLAPIDEASRPYFAPPNVDTAEAAAAGNGALFVVWRTHFGDDRGVGIPPELVGKVIRADGSEVHFQISAEPQLEEKSPVAVFDGSNFFTAWLDHGLAFGTPPIPIPAQIRARRYTTSGDPIEATPVKIWDRLYDSTESLFAAATPRGVVLAWSQPSSKLMIARLTVPAAAQPVELTVPSTLGTLAAIAPLDSGELDVYWTRRVSGRTVTISYERLTASFASTGDRFTSAPFVSDDYFPEVSATAIATLPVVVHSQADDAAAGITRLFVRQASNIRRRAVR